MMKPFDLERVVGVGEDVLKKRFGGSTRLQFRRQMGHEKTRNCLLWCDVLDGPLGAPERIVIKRSNAGGGAGWDDLAGVRFLNDIDFMPPIAPEFYGGDVDEELVILEDLSDHRGLLRDILNGNDPLLAEKVLVAYMKAMGQLHAATTGKRAQYEGVCASIGLMPPKTFAIHSILNRLENFETCVDSLGVSLSLPAQKDLLRVIALIREPGVFDVYTQGDCCLTNALWFEGHVRFVDFEMGGYRHAFIDGVFPLIRYLMCNDSGKIPDGIKIRMMDTYQCQLGARCSGALDDGIFGKAVSAACAGWMANRLFGLGNYWDVDKPLRVITNRQQIVMCLEAFILVSESTGTFKALADVVDTILNRLKGKWPEAFNPIPYFPAFVRR